MLKERKRIGPWWPAMRSSRSISAASSSSVIPTRACRAIHSGRCESISAAARICSSSQSDLSARTRRSGPEQSSSSKPVQPAGVAEVGGRGEDVELEPEPAALDAA